MSLIPSVLAALCAFVIFLPQANGQGGGNPSQAPIVDGSDINRELYERQQKVENLSPQEREALAAAYQKAAEDPAVQAALAARQKAIDEFQGALRRSMLAADPSVEPLLERRARANAPQ